jgi:hypothetical protein
MGSEWSASGPSRFTPEGSSLGTVWMGAWVGLNVGLNYLENRHIRWPAGIRAAVCLLLSRQHGHYTDYVSPTSKMCWNLRKLYGNSKFATLKLRVCECWVQVAQYMIQHRAHSNEDACPITGRALLDRICYHHLNKDVLRGLYNLFVTSNLFIIQQQKI